MDTETARRERRRLNPAKASQDPPVGDGLRLGSGSEMRAGLNQILRIMAEGIENVQQRFQGVAPTKAWNSFRGIWISFRWAWISFRPGLEFLPRIWISFAALGRATRDR